MSYKFFNNKMDDNEVELAAKMKTEIEKDQICYLVSRITKPQHASYFGAISIIELLDEELFRKHLWEKTSFFFILFEDAKAKINQIHECKHTTLCIFTIQSKKNFSHASMRSEDFEILAVSRFKQRKLSEIILNPNYPEAAEILKRHDKQEVSSSEEESSSSSKTI